MREKMREMALWLQWNMTALHMACDAGFVGLAEKLVRYGADINTISLVSDFMSAIIARNIIVACL
jgi:ankyrin repeat protein